MKNTRIAIGIYACLCILVAFLLFRHLEGSKNLIIALYVLFNSSIIVGGLFFERGRYKSAISADGNGWHLTKERFIDDSTGKTMAVRYNQQTGERDYVVYEQTEK